MKFVKWLASFDDPNEADAFLKRQAKTLVTLGFAGRYGVSIRTEDGKHHVELWEYK